MTLFAVQFLEGGHDWSGITAQAARLRLREAGSRVPLSYVLLGWDVPERLVEACSAETARLGARLYRWHPLLTSDGTLQPQPAWRTVGLCGEAVAGFGGMPEFTFMCPNQPAVREAIQRRIESVVQSGLYQGLFLDRIRFPSPAADPWEQLGCICPDCQRLAQEGGCNLADVQKDVQDLLQSSSGALSLAQRLLSGGAAPSDDPRLEAVDAFLDFRQASITRMVQLVAEQARSGGMQVGLDCFSPCLMRMVGQDLVALDGCCDWIKTMTYGRTFGPAGLPFELSGLASWLGGRYGLEEAVILEAFSQSVGFDLPRSRAALRKPGLASEALTAETRLGKYLGVRKLLGGVALVELENINEITDEQAQADAAAFAAGGADGLVIAWDLWHIPPKRLDWFKTSAGRSSWNKKTSAAPGL